MTEHLTARIALRPARSEDFDYCARLYFEGMDTVIKELNLNMDAQVADFNVATGSQAYQVLVVHGVMFSPLRCQEMASAFRGLLARR
jgi:hypothetical protein